MFGEPWCPERSPEALPNEVPPTPPEAMLEELMSDDESNSVVKRNSGTETCEGVRLWTADEEPAAAVEGDIGMASSSFEQTSRRVDGSFGRSSSRYTMS